MRISDWSSDVCSSDLAMRTPLPWSCSAPTRRGPSHTKRKPPWHAALQDYYRSFPRWPGPQPPEWPRTAIRRDFLPFADRQSVASGKSVSVLVDLGGPRILTKKKYMYILLRNAQ